MPKPKKIQYNGDSKVIAALANVGNWLLDNAAPYVLPIASSSTLGGVKVGQNLTIDSDGTLNAQAGGTDVEVTPVVTTGTKIAEIEVDGTSVDLYTPTQVQADWNETGTSAPEYIKNKPASMPASDVYAWAKAATKPSYTASEVGAIPSTDKGANNGVASLDSSGKVPSSQLPSYVDDVVEGYYDSTTDRFYEESTFETVIPPVDGKSWVDVATNKSYRWTGSVYTRVDEGVQLGTTHSTAAYGDEGATAYAHATESGKISTAVASGLYKIAATAEGHVAGLTQVQKSDLTALGVADASDLANYMQKGVDYVTAGQKSDITIGTKATAEGDNTSASGNYSHAEGYNSSAEGIGAHAENRSLARGGYSHAENSSSALHGDSHAEGYYTMTGAMFQHVEGQLNVGRSDTVHEIGWGDSQTFDRKNIFAVKQNGMVFASDGADDISDYTADSDNRVLTYGNTYGDATDMDGKIRVELTTAQFNALSQAQKDDPRITYYVTDKPSLGYPVQDDGTATDLTDGALATGRTIESWGNGKIIPAPVASTLVASKTDTSELTGTYTPTRNGRLVLYCGAGSANRTIKARMLSLEANVKYGNYIYTTLPAYNSESLMYLDVYKGVNYYYQCNGHGSAYIYMT